MSGLAVAYAVLCGWCGCVTGYAPVEHSTGLCQRCLAQHFGEDDDDAA